MSLNLEFYRTYLSTVFLWIPGYIRLVNHLMFFDKNTVKPLLTDIFSDFSGKETFFQLFNRETSELHTFQIVDIYISVD